MICTLKLYFVSNFVKVDDYMFSEEKLFLSQFHLYVYDVSIRSLPPWEFGPLLAFRGGVLREKSFVRLL